MAGGGQFSAELLLDEGRTTGRDVDVFADQVGVDARRKIIEVEIDVFQAGTQLGGEVVTQILGRQVVEPATRINKGAARLGHLLAIDGQKAVRVDGRGQAEAGAAQHRRPEEGVEVENVLADEVIQLGLAALAPEIVKLELGLRAQVLETCHVADRRIQPHVEILSRGIRNLEAEIRSVARDVPVLEAGGEPFVELVRHFRLYVAGIGDVRKQIAAQLVFEVAELEEVMFGFFGDRRHARQRRHGILQFGRRVGGAAHFTAVAVLVLGPALRALALDEPVGQEHLLDRIVRLLDHAPGDMPGIAQTCIYGIGERTVLGRVGGVVVVKGHAELGEVTRVFGVHALDELLGGDAFLLRPQHHRCAVGVVGADVMALMAAQFLETHPDVGLDVFHQVSEMNRPVGVGQGAGNQYLAFRGGHGHGGPGDAVYPRFVRDITSLAKRRHDISAGAV